ncbi:MAG TPA: CmcI family methyltransferase [Candidatus Baltobacteraceae bacterium]|jgi:cephalosporin hydroxylase
MSNRFPIPRDADLIAASARDEDVQAIRAGFMSKAFAYGYHRNFEWLGIPIIQLPQDIIALGEIIWDTCPTLVIETGVAFGGALVFYASQLELIGGRGETLGVEIEMRPQNERALLEHPMSKRISLIKGSSTDESVARAVAERAREHERVMVVLDSNHAHAHVARELELYAGLVSAGCYLVVFGTSVADLPVDSAYQRPWTPEHNPKTALDEWLAAGQPFEVDRALSDRLILSDGPGGYLRRVR